MSEMTKSEIEAYMKASAEAIAGVVPKGSCFVLVVFDQEGEAQSISHGPREDVITALKKASILMETEDGRRGPSLKCFNPPEGDPA